MITIDWHEYKEFKQFSHKNDNFEIVIDFLISYYNMTSPREMYEVLANDDTAVLMLQKRKIKDAVMMESYLFSRQ